MSVDTLSKYTTVCEKGIGDAHFGKSALKVFFCFTLAFGGFCGWFFGGTGGNSCVFESLLVHFLKLSLKFINKNDGAGVIILLNYPNRWSFQGNKIEIETILVNGKVS